MRFFYSFNIVHNKSKNVSRSFIFFFMSQIALFYHLVVSCYFIIFPFDLSPSSIHVNFLNFHPDIPIFLIASSNVLYPFVHVDVTHKKILFHKDKHQMERTWNYHFEVLVFTHDFKHEFQIGTWNLKGKIWSFSLHWCDFYLSLDWRQTMSVWRERRVRSLSKVKVQAKFYPWPEFELNHVSHHIQQFINRDNEVNTLFIFTDSTYERMELDVC